MAAFFEQNIVIVYFIYGLAFFLLGFAVWLESRRTSEFRLARAMGPLALFGFLHGLHEWMEMFQLLGRAVPSAPAIAQSDAYNITRLGLLVVSFVMLIVFGVRLIHSSVRGRGSERTFVLLSAGLLIVIWLVSVIITQSVYRFCLADCLVAIDVLTRYILGIPGAMLAAWAMILEQRAFRERGMASFGRDLMWAALALLGYGVIGQAFPPESPLFPSNVINSDLWLQTFSFPVQFFRALMAIGVTIFVLRALRAFALEHRQMLDAANTARLEAQQEALATQEQARIETEELNVQLRSLVQDLTFLFDLSRGFAETLDREALLQRALARILAGIPRVSAGMILLREGDDEPLAVVANEGCEALETNAGEPLLVCNRLEQMGRKSVTESTPVVYCRGEMVRLPQHAGAELSVSGEDRIAGQEGRIVAVPLHAKQQAWGALVLGVRRDAPPLASRDLWLISTIAGQLSLAVENATLYKEVQAREVLRGQLYQRIVAAQERERQRIARELHDGTGQVLTGLGLGLRAAAETVHHDPELASQQLLELKDLNARALTELRDLIADLRPSVLDDMGLVPALQGQVNAIAERTDIEIGFDVRGTRRRLPAEIETIIFRIAQEALTNVVKHARAQRALVRLVFENGGVHLVVNDDGTGFDPQQALHGQSDERRAWGLLGMQERVGLVGGLCEVASEPDKGTTVRVFIPKGAQKDEEGTVQVGEDISRV